VNFLHLEKESLLLYLKIFRHLKSFKKGRSFKSWIYKTAVNCSHDYLKKRTKHLLSGPLLPGLLKQSGLMP